MPDRVIDAPKPKAFYFEDYDDKHDPEFLYHKWDADRYIQHLEAKVARLEAEKQEAHTEAWNAAIEKAAELAYTHEETGLVGAIMALSKPTAAKQGDPS